MFACGQDDARAYPTALAGSTSVWGAGCDRAILLQLRAQSRVPIAVRCERVADRRERPRWRTEDRRVVRTSLLRRDPFRTASQFVSKPSPSVDRSLPSRGDAA